MATVECNIISVARYLTSCNGSKFHTTEISIYTLYVYAGHKKLNYTITKKNNIRFTSQGLNVF